MLLLSLAVLLSTLLLVPAQPQPPLLSCKKSLELPCDGNNCIQRQQVTDHWSGLLTVVYEIVGLIAIIELSSAIMV